MRANMSRSRKRRNKKAQQSQSAQKSPEPKFVKTCKKLYKQITAFCESKVFHKLIPTNDKFCTEYKSINPHPISFETIKCRLYSKPCYYANYEAFNEDVMKIFEQEKRLKKYKGNNVNVKKRMLNSKQVNNYWNTLTASYKQYGFDAIENNNNDHDDDSKEEPEEDNDINYENYDNKQKKKETKKQKQKKKLLSDIKKRVKRPDEALQLQSPNKKRKLYNPNNQNTKTEIGESPYTPFADKSRVFKQMIGNSDELFKNLQGPESGLAIRQRLDFTRDKDKNHNKNVSDGSEDGSDEEDADGDDDDKQENDNMIEHTFQIKWKYEDSAEVQCLEIEAERMDSAVKKFYGIHSPSQVKIMTVTLTRNAYF